MMDSKDKKLICLLDRNSREKEVNLAKILKTSKQVVKYRIHRLEREGIIKQYQTLLNLNLFGINIYANIYFSLGNLNGKKEEEIIQYLINHKNIGYVAQTGGRFDISIVIVARDIFELEQKIDEIVKNYSNELSNYALSLRSKGEKLNKRYLYKISNPQKKIILSEASHLIILDKLDKQILGILTQNARTPALEVANKLNKPFSTIRNRIKQLEDNKIISGYSLLIDLKKIGFQNYKIFLKLRKHQKAIEQKLLKFIEEHENISWYFKTIGEYNYELRVELENQEMLQVILNSIRRELDLYLERVETLIIFKELKEDFSVLLV